LNEGLESDQMHFVSNMESKTRLKLSHGIERCPIIKEAILPNDNSLL
jgi:hypothetical protein